MKYGLGYTLITGITGFLSRTVLYFRRTELNYIINILNKKDDIKILDYGCNTGYFLNLIKNRYPTKRFELYGADINKYAIKYARKRYSGFRFFNTKGDFLYKHKFDVIILSHVLEHIKDRENFIRKLKKLMKKNGLLIIAIPQERIRGDCTIVQLIYNFLRFRFKNPHVTKITLADLKKLISRNKLYLKRYIYTNFFYPFKSTRLRFDSWSLVTEIRKIKETTYKKPALSCKVYKPATSKKTKR